ncbi:LysE family transporter [Aurantimonas sp. MSK8Z-1]|uniref:LysE family translocator n=1 Tax=Mangrovibrevibacter kandeliae TaxID=2968473 RepID=UPI002118F1E5|nr:LysE family transporter [Aurantimonas sp. MSK8Z-1]MCW4116573.1 LysE family transporter [Aurantimonas sp. MSK8Z-1]
MSIQPLLPLLLFAAIATLSPGGATTLATASGAHFGYRRSLPLMTGIALGLGILAAASAAGLAGLLLAIPGLAIAIRAIGTAYLLWLAVRLARSGSPHARGAAAQPTSFVGGLWLLFNNPKGWAMTLGAAASFATLADTPGRLALILGVVFASASALSLSLWCLAGQMLSRLLRRDWQWRLVNGALAALLAASILPMWLD